MSTTHSEPFLSFYTPTYRRPSQLAACLESVRRQTLAACCEQVVIPDHVGLGVGGMYGRVPMYAQALHGEYVHFLCDDDTLAGPKVVADLKAIIDVERIDDVGPDVVIVGSRKPGGYYPDRNEGPPVLGSIDLGCFVVKRELWQATCETYGRRYEGDYDYISTLWQMSSGAVEGGLPLRWSWHKELYFVIGEASRGRYEGEWP